MENTLTAEAVIWIASYPKSGNTWVQAVVRAAGRPFGFPRRDVDVYKLMAEGRPPDVVGGVRPEVSTLNTTVLKTHSRYKPNHEIHAELNLKTSGFIHVIRNPLDLLLSYINFTRAQYERRRNLRHYQEALFLDLLGFDKVIPYEEWVSVKLEDIPRSNLDHALSRFTETGTAIPGVRMAGGSWLDHSFSWLDAGKTLPAVFLRYEDLLKGPEHFLPLSKLFTFSESQIVGAATRVNERLHDQQYKSIFFNKMSSYYYPGFFSSGMISRFLDRFGGRLKQLGYEDLPEHALAPIADT